MTEPERMRIEKIRGAYRTLEQAEHYAGTTILADIQFLLARVDELEQGAAVEVQASFNEGFEAGKAEECQSWIDGRAGQGE